ncbi:hypothetical protein [Micromonospora sp. NPDC023956]|uniref:hypothetical protein n=1 Tax=Micromonospora sp. NPDC023956 TaxID=3155722 RepID=UPI0033C7F83D
MVRRPSRDYSAEVTLVHVRSWAALTCRECRRPWPCEPFREALPLTTPGQRAAAVVRMTAEARRVRRELVEIAPATLVGRFLWWLNLGRNEAQMIAWEVWPDASVPPRT